MKWQWEDVVTTCEIEQWVACAEVKKTTEVYAQLLWIFFAFLFLLVLLLEEPFLALCVLVKSHALSLVLDSLKHSVHNNVELLQKPHRETRQGDTSARDEIEDCFAEGACAS